MRESGRVKERCRSIVGDGTEFERLEDFHTALRAAFKDEAAPARHLALANACPTAPEIRAGEINEISHRAKAAD